MDGEVAEEPLILSSSLDNHYLMIVHKFIIPILDWNGFGVTWETLPKLGMWIKHGFSIQRFMHPSPEHPYPLSHSDSLFYTLSALHYPHHLHIDTTSTIKRLMPPEANMQLYKVYVGDYGIDFIFDTNDISSLPTFVELLKVVEQTVGPSLGSGQHIFINALELEILQDTSKSYGAEPLLQEEKTGNAFNFFEHPWELLYFPETWIVGQRYNGICFSIAYLIGAAYSLLQTYKSISAVLKSEEPYTSTIFEDWYQGHGYLKKHVLGLHNEYHSFIDSIITPFKDGLTSLDTSFQQLLVDVYGMDSSPNLFISWRLQQIANDYGKYQESLEQCLHCEDILVKTALDTMVTQIEEAKSMFISSATSYITSFINAGNFWYRIHQNHVNTSRTILSLFISTLAIIASFLSTK